MQLNINPWVKLGFLKVLEVTTSNMHMLQENIFRNANLFDQFLYPMLFSRFCNLFQIDLLIHFSNSASQAAIDDIDSILGTTEENKQNPSISPSKSPQLHAPRPKEMQRILQEHQQQMHAIEKDKKEMEEEKEKQRLAEEHRRSSQVEERVQTGQSSAPPPTPAAAMSPVGSTGLIEETPVTTRPASVVSRVSNALTSHEPAQTSPGNNVPDKSDEVSTNPPHPSGDVLNDGKTPPESETEHQIQRSLSTPSGASPKEDLGKRKRASSLKAKTKSRTPSPREGGKGKRSSSAKD